MKSALSRELQEICDISNPVTNYLLGDDLSKMKDPKETARIASTSYNTLR